MSASYRIVGTIHPNAIVHYELERYLPHVDLHGRVQCTHVTVFSTFTSRCHSFSHLPAEETVSWSCWSVVCREGVDVMRAVSSANWLQVVLVFVQAWGRSMV